MRTDDNSMPFRMLRALCTFEVGGPTWVVDASATIMRYELLILLINRPTCRFANWEDYRGTTNRRSVL